MWLKMNKDIVKDLKVLKEQVIRLEKKCKKTEELFLTKRGDSYE